MNKVPKLRHLLLYNGVTEKNHSSAPEFIMKSPRRLTKFVLFLGVLAVAAFFGYRYWTRTPQYSLLQIQQAASSRNVEQFEKYVDIDSTVHGFVDDLVEVSLAAHDSLSPQSSLNPLDALSKQFARGVASAIKPALAIAAKQSLRYYILNGKVEDENPSSTTGSPSFNFGKTVRERSAKFDGIEYVKTQNDVSHVGLRMLGKQPDAKPFIIELEMRWMNGYWQVKKWSNATTIIPQLGLRSLNLAPKSEEPNL